MTSELTLSGHIEELRRAVALSLIALIASVILCYFVSDTLYKALIPDPSNSPLERYTIKKELLVNSSDKTIAYEGHHVPPHSQLEVEVRVPKMELVVLSPLDGFFVSVKLAILSGVVLSSVVWLYNLLRFVFPALRPREMRAVKPVLWSILLFGLLGFYLAKSAVIPLATEFFSSINSTFGESCFGLKAYVDYCLMLYVSTILLCQLIGTMTLLVYFGVISESFLQQGRRFAYLGAFILGAILTPPDVFSQVVAATFLIVSYEMWLILARFRKSRF